MSEDASLTTQPVIRTLVQLKIAKAILWLLSDRRKRYPTDPRFQCLYRAEIVRKSNVNIQDLNLYIPKLERYSIVNRIFVHDRPQWWVLFVTDEGEETLRASVNAQISD